MRRGIECGSCQTPSSTQADHTTFAGRGARTRLSGQQSEENLKRERHRQATMPNEISNRLAVLTLIAQSCLHVTRSLSAVHSRACARLFHSESRLREAAI